MWSLMFCHLLLAFKNPDYNYAILFKYHPVEITQMKLLLFIENSVLKIVQNIIFFFLDIYDKHRFILLLLYTF